jgi:hypothetical protein
MASICTQRAKTDVLVQAALQTIVDARLQQHSLDGVGQSEFWGRDDWSDGLLDGNWCCFLCHCFKTVSLEANGGFVVMVSRNGGGFVYQFVRYTDKERCTMGVCNSFVLTSSCLAMGKGKPGSSKGVVASKSTPLQVNQAEVANPGVLGSEKKRKPAETEEGRKSRKLAKAVVAAPPPEPESDSVDDSEDVSDDESQGGEEIDGSAAEFDDDDDDSVDSDTSGTISEDLDLNKPNDSDEDESSDDSDDSDEDSEDDDKTVTVDFDFKDPQQIDFLSLRNLLSRYLPASDAAVSTGDDEDKEEDENESGAAGETADRSKAAPKREKKPISALVKSFNPSEIADAIIEQVTIAANHGWWSSWHGLVYVTLLRLKLAPQ